MDPSAYQDAVPQSARDQNAPAHFDLAARRAGLLLIVTALASVLMVFARVAADADQPTLLESLASIAESRAMYATSAAARILSGITLFAAALLLLRTRIIRQGLATPLVPYMLVISGAVTAFSGICALALTFSAYAGSDVTISASIETINALRWFAGKLGFAIAGLALLVVAYHQWKVGGAPGKIAPASAIIGLIMQLIWIDAATIMHPIVGVAFMVWLLAVGLMLAKGRAERLFRSI